MMKIVRYKLRRGVELEGSTQPVFRIETRESSLTGVSVVGFGESGMMVASELMPWSDWLAFKQLCLVDESEVA